MSHKQITIITSIALVGVGGVMALFFLDPTKYAFFPKCAFYVTTGYSCPGCGSSRALYALTHGKVFEAFRLNPGILFLLTIGVTDFARYIRSAIQARPYHTLFANVWLVVGLVIAMLIYAILRNLPWAPFTNLAP